MAETAEEQYTRVFLHSIKECGAKNKKRIEGLFRRVGRLSPVEGMTLCFLIIRTIGDDVRSKGGGNSAEIAFVTILNQTMCKEPPDPNVLFQSADKMPDGIEKMKKAKA
jgi:hypothetical protein